MAALPSHITPDWLENLTLHSTCMNMQMGDQTADRSLRSVSGLHLLRESYIDSIEARRAFGKLCRRPHPPESTPQHSELQLHELPGTEGPNGLTSCVRTPAVSLTQSARQTLGRWNISVNARDLVRLCYGARDEAWAKSAGLTQNTMLLFSMRTVAVA